MPLHTGADAGGWAARHWRALLAELAATLLLVLLGVAACLPPPAWQPGDAPPPLTNAALGFGFTVTTLVTAFGPASGAHMNPAVTLAMLLVGQITPALAFAYVVMQCLGATLGYALLAVIAPLARVPPAGLTLPAPALGAAAACAMEMLMTFTLVMSVCGMLHSAPPDPTGSLKVGLVIAGLVYSGGWMTGTSLNPARSIGPVIYHNVWTDHWVYWAGPLLGGALAALLHRALRPPRAAPLACPAPPSPAPTQELLPLRK